MEKKKCGECGFITPYSSAIMCPKCGGDLVPIEEPRKETSSQHPIPSAITRNGDLGYIVDKRASVFGINFYPGQMILLSSYPGVGKSTICSQIMKEFNSGLYISSEENKDQIFSRWERLEVNRDLICDNNYETVLANIDKKYDIIVIDSINSFFKQNEYSKVADFVYNCVQIGKKCESKPVIIFISQVARSGNTIGYESIDHCVDTIWNLAKTDDGFITLVESKNRFGITDIGYIFKHEQKGLVQIDGDFADRMVVSQGVVKYPQRYTNCYKTSFVQSIVSPKLDVYPERISVGIPPNKIKVMSEVLARYLGISMKDYSIYTSTKQSENCLYDIPIFLSLYSSYKNIEGIWNIPCYGEILFNGEIINNPKIKSIDDLLKYKE